MEGRVWVESNLGSGSTFTVEIPLHVVAHHVGPELSPSDTGLADEPLHLLAVDDNDVNLLVLEQLLASLGHHVTRASSGAQAMSMLAVQRFDLVLSDIQMPEMNGTELLICLRREAGPNQTVPVVALTADVTSGGRQHYLDQGFTDHAAKPIRIEDLLGAIARALNAPQPAAVQAA